MAEIEASIENPEYAGLREELIRQREELKRGIEEAERELNERQRDRLSEIKRLRNEIKEYEETISTLREEPGVVNYFAARETLRGIVKELRGARDQIRERGFEDPKRERQRLSSLEGVLKRDGGILRGLISGEMILLPELRWKIETALRYNEEMVKRIEGEIVERGIEGLEIDFARDPLGNLSRVLGGLERLRQRYPEQEERISGFQGRVKETVERKIKEALDKGEFPLDFQGIERLCQALATYFGEEISRFRKEEEGVYGRLSEFCGGVVNKMIGEIRKFLKEKEEPWEVCRLFQNLLRTGIFNIVEGQISPSSLVEKFAPEAGRKIIREIIRKEKKGLKQGILRVLVREGKNVAFVFLRPEKNKKGEQGYRIVAVVEGAFSPGLPPHLIGCKPGKVFYTAKNPPEWLREGLDTGEVKITPRARKAPVKGEGSSRGGQSIGKIIPPEVRERLEKLEELG